MIAWEKRYKEDSAMNEKERSVQFHIQCSQGDVGKYCILPGDPGRCKAIAQRFDGAVHVKTNR